MNLSQTQNATACPCVDGEASDSAAVFVLNWMSVCVFVVVAHRSAISPTAAAICGPFFLCVCLSLQHPCLRKTARHCVHHIWQWVWQQRVFKEEEKNIEFTSLGSGQCVSVSFDDLCIWFHLAGFILVKSWLYKTFSPTRISNSIQCK